MYAWCGVALFCWMIAACFRNLCCLEVLSYPQNVTLISVHIGANPLYGFYQAAPVFAVAVDHMKAIYPERLGNMRYVSLPLLGYDLCQDGGDHTTEFVAEKYYNSSAEVFDNTTQFPVLAHADCSAQSMPLADLARAQLCMELSGSACIYLIRDEWSLPLFTSVAGEIGLVNKTRYSTTSAIASLAGSDVITTIYKVFERFRWRTITLICDDLKQFPGLSNFFVIQCKDAQRMLADRGYTWYSRTIDTTGEVRFHDYLTEFKDRCRVFLFLTLPRFVRQIMVAARELQMTQGDYVFITLQPTTRPGLSPITWKSPERADGNRTDSRVDDEVIFQAYQNLIVLTGVNPDWDAITNLTDEITAKKALYNVSTPPGDERNELQICIYESTMMFAKVFNENYPAVFSMPKSEFISKTFNRTFNFAARNFSTDKNGAMINYIVVLRLDPISKIFRTAMVYDPIVQSFTNVNGALWYWVNRNDTPPDKPPCGYANNECSLSESESAMTKGIAAALALAVVIAGTIGTTLLIKRQRDLANLWWFIDSAALAYPPNKSYIQRIESISALEEGVVGIRLHYRYQNVYGTVISIENEETYPLANYRKLLAHLYNLNHIAHENIAPLIGLLQNGHMVTLVTEYGSKGTLRHLLSSDQFRMDPKLHCSLCWDLFEGVEFLQRTVFGCHGNLNSFLCLIDSRFSLKICQTGYERIYEILHARKEGSNNENVEAVQNLWKPLELIRLKDQDTIAKSQKLKDNKETDIFSMAMIIYEIVTHNLPHNIENFHPDTVKAALGKVLYEGNFRISEEDLLVAFPLRNLLNSCFANLSYQRPNTKLFRSKLQKIMIKPKPYFEQIARDLEIHARRLEDIVKERNLELSDETEKADLLLQELMPLPIVKRLRNREVVVPEYYEGVTVLFSDLPAFGHISQQCSPMEIINFLNTVYSIFDEVIPHFDVYKVETINDSYIIASGVPVRNESEHAAAICNLAIELIRISRKTRSPVNSAHSVESRIGVNTGPVVAGVIGQKMPRYCLFGDTVNTCSRMEKLGEEGKIHLSETTSVMVVHRKEFFVIPRGEIYVKGKGLMNTYWLTK